MEPRTARDKQFGNIGEVKQDGEGTQGLGSEEEDRETGEHERGKPDVPLVVSAWKPWSDQSDIGGLLQKLKT